MLLSKVYSRGTMLAILKNTCQEQADMTTHQKPPQRSTIFMPSKMVNTDVFFCWYEIKHRSSQCLKVAPLDLLDVSLICDDTVMPSVIPAVYQVIKFRCQAVWVG